MTSHKIRQYLTVTCKTPIQKLLFLIKSSKNLKNMAVIQPRPTRTIYQCVTFCDHWTSFNVIFDVCDVYHVKGPNPYFDISVFYLSAITRDIDLKFIQDTYRVVINSPTIFDLHIGQR